LTAPGPWRRIPPGGRPMSRPFRSALKVDRVSNEGQMGPFQQCYREKATPIWQSYCRQEPDSRQCKR
jgi:hypothetical protein